MAEKEEELENTYTVLNEIGKLLRDKCGLKTSKHKTKLLKYSKNFATNEFSSRVGGDIVEKVTLFHYLGSKVTG